MQAFTCSFDPMRVRFGRGTIAEVSSELDALGCSRALVLSTPEQGELAARIASLLGDRAVAGFAGARMHTPIEVTQLALEQLRGADADAVIAVGGGSTIGLGKALVLRSGVKSIAIPTTYAGSEMTPILGETEAGRKTTQRTARVLPSTVIYDVDLTLSLPPGLSATSGLNAIAHAAEALYAPDANPIVTIMAEDAVRALSRSLPRLIDKPDDHDARTQALYGAWLCGICLGRVAMSLHHKLCHVIGGLFDLPHAETHAVMLPHTVGYNAPAAPEAMMRLARALGAQDVGQGLEALARRLSAPRSLAALGMPEDGIAPAVAQALQNPYANPRPFDGQALEGLLRRAYAGSPVAA